MHIQGGETIRVQYGILRNIRTTLVVKITEVDLDTMSNSGRQVSSAFYPFSLSHFFLRRFLLHAYVYSYPPSCILLLDKIDGIYSLALDSLFGIVKKSFPSPGYVYDHMRGK
jgi:hypothetical protein